MDITLFAKRITRKGNYAYRKRRDQSLMEVMQASYLILIRPLIRLRRMQNETKEKNAKLKVNG